MRCIYFEKDLNDFFSKWVMTQNIFFFDCPRHYDRGLIVAIEYYYQIRNQKEHNIITSRIISSHVYNETSCKRQKFKKKI